MDPDIFRIDLIGLYFATKALQNTNFHTNTGIISLT